jgi:hypothetical protein
MDHSCRDCRPLLTKRRQSLHSRRHEADNTRIEEMPRIDQSCRAGADPTELADAMARGVDDRARRGHELIDLEIGLAVVGRRRRSVGRCRCIVHTAIERRRVLARRGGIRRRRS